MSQSKVLKSILSNCYKCGRKADYRVDEHGKWSCGCFHCRTYYSSYTKRGAEEGWEWLVNIKEVSDND